MKIVTVGDSHSFFTFTAYGGDFSPHVNVYERDGITIKVNWLGPWTMHRVGRDGHNFDQYIQESDKLLFLFFGEIDVRRHLANQINQGIPANKVIEELARKYIDTVRNSAFVNKIVVSMVIPPPHASESPQADESSHLGTDEERRLWNKKLNEWLTFYCKKYSIKHINPYVDYLNSQGMLNVELTDSLHTHVGAPEFAVKRLRTFLKNLRD
jgi:hypothetical protein